MNPDELREKLARLEPSALADALVRLASEDRPVRERVETLALRAETAAFADSLARRMKRFRSGRAFIDYAASAGFARELGAWLDDVEASLLPRDPDEACKLLEAFIRSDEHILDRVDDSDGAIGDAFRRACGLWLRAAAALPASPARVERVRSLHAENAYGTRDALLDGAATLLSERELRQLARIYEDEALAEDREGKSERAFVATVCIGQLATALGDAALYEHSVTMRSPRPNRLQANDIAEQYLRFGPVARAVEWLTAEDDDDRGEPSARRLDLLAQAYEKLGDRSALLGVRRRLSERSLSAERFRDYAALLPPEEQGAAQAQAVARAERSRDTVAAGSFLLALGASDEASALILRDRARLEKSFYEDLHALALDFEKAEMLPPAIACYRALVDQILGAGRSPAYRHASRYVARMAALAAKLSDLGDLPTHAEYVAQLSERHGRKYAFWKLADGGAK